MYLYCLMISLVMLLGCSNGAVKENSQQRVHLQVTPEKVSGGSWEEIIAPMAWWINIHGDESLYQYESRNFTKEQLQGFAAYMYLSEVVKEGHQWFFTSTPEKARRDVLEGLVAVGFTKYAGIYQEGLRKYLQNRNKEADFSMEDHEIILLWENQDVEAEFRRFARDHSRQFLFDQWVEKPE